MPILPRKYEYVLLSLVFTTRGRLIEARLTFVLLMDSGQ
jgi:hypothetical protein